MDFLWGFLAVVAVFAAAGIRIVEQQTVVIVQFLGRYSCTLEAGLNWIFVPFQLTAGKLSLKIEAVPATVEVKTSDNMFVSLPVNLMIQVEPQNAKDAFYKLEQPHEQVRAWVLNTVRSTAASMTLEEMFNDREKVVGEVRQLLTSKLSEFGYRLEGVLIDQPTVSQEVQSSFNRVVAATREKEAALQEGEAVKIRIVKQAEAEADAQRERAKGLADSRRILAAGLQESLNGFAKIPQNMALALLIETNRIDALREASKHGNLVLLDLAKTDGAQKALLPLLNSLRKMPQAEVSLETLSPPEQHSPE
jgi:regulator of protease activity HflC (stomatin/prohibitin superfamily)